MRHTPSLFISVFALAGTLLLVGCNKPDEPQPNDPTTTPTATTESEPVTPVEVGDRVEASAYSFNMPKKWKTVLNEDGEDSPMVMVASSEGKEAITVLQSESINNIDTPGAQEAMKKSLKNAGFSQVEVVERNGPEGEKIFGFHAVDKQTKGSTTHTAQVFLPSPIEGDLGFVITVTGASEKASESILATVLSTWEWK